MARVKAVHSNYTTEPVVGGNYFSVGWVNDITVEGYGRIQMNQINVYEVKDGQIVLEHFFTPAANEPRNEEKPNESTENGFAS